MTEYCPICGNELIIIASPNFSPPENCDLIVICKYCEYIKKGILESSVIIVSEEIK